ncbi:hypothetical protein COOONC_25149 [Cooperia oncophora]
MNVCYNEDSTVSVVACFGHVGHELDPALLRWTDEQLEYLKLMIEEFSADYIVQKLRKDHASKKSKLYFITKKDLWNKKEKNPEDGIRYFKPHDEPTGKGFILVIITPLQLKWLRQFGQKGISVDDTHNITRYALKLATIMVVDDRDRGLPAGIKIFIHVLVCDVLNSAFLLSAEMTSNEVKILFDEIKRVVPNFAPKSLVSDESLAFYNGFTSSFPGRSVDHFLCRFHILQSWKRKTKECVKPELQKGIVSAFRKLLRISNEPEFHANLSEILTHLRLNGCTRLIHYLQREYLWWLLRLKQEKRKRKANSRIDFVVETLIRAVNELAVDLRSQGSFAPSFRVKENNVQHKLGVQFYKENRDKIHKVGTLAWNVEATTSHTVYRVESKEECACNYQVNNHCPRCHVCPYAVSCSCSDGALAGIACLHSHAVKLYGEKNNCSIFNVRQVRVQSLWFQEPIRNQLLKQSCKQNR